MAVETTANEIWRDFVTNGVPASGANRPAKAAIRKWGTALEALLNAGALGDLWFSTKSDLDADLAHDAGTVAVVYDDSTRSNNGFYKKIGSSGSGSWTQLTTFLPGYQFVTATDDGNSTANAWTMDTSPNLPSGDGVALVSMVAPATSTSETVTVSFDGDTAVTIKTASGNDPAVGGLVAGMSLLGVLVNGGTEFRMRSDQTSSAIQQAAEDAQAAAEDARDAAQSYAADAISASGLARFSTVTSLLSDNNDQIGYAGSGAVIEVSAGALIEVLVGQFTYEVAASDALDEHVSTVGGVKLYALPSADGSLNVLQFGAKRDWQSVANPGTDDTAAINNALSAAAALGVGEVVMPEGDYSVSEDASLAGGPAIIHQSGVRLRLAGARIRLRPTAEGAYSVIMVDGTVGSSVVGFGEVYGDRPDHQGSAAEHGMALRLWDVEDFYAGPYIKYLDTWGDGIYIGEKDPHGPNPPSKNKNIVIDNPMSTNNRRNGISIIYGDGITINNPFNWDLNSEIFLYTIDIEPNWPDQYLRNIEINNPKATNPTDGILAVMLQNHDATSEPVSITVNNLYCRDAGLEHSHNERGAVKFYGPASGVSPGGFIVFNSPEMEDIDRQMFTWQNWSNQTAKVIINKPVGRNYGRNTHGLSSVRGNAFYHGSLALPASHDVGGIVINEPLLIGPRLARFEAASGQAISDLTILNPTHLELSDFENALQLVSPGPPEKLRVRDENRQFEHSISTTFALTQTTLIPNLIYEGDSAASNLALDNSIPFGFEVSILYAGTNELMIRADSGDVSFRFFPINEARMATSTKGSSVKLRRVDGGFLVLNREGTWSDTTP